MAPPAVARQAFILMAALRAGPLASALQFAQIIYLVGAAFQGIAYQPVVLLLIGLQIALHSYCKTYESVADDEARKEARKERRKAASAKPAMP